MIVCKWPLGCRQDVIGDDTSDCFYHRKIRAGLIELTRDGWSAGQLGLVSMPAAIAAEAARRRRDYFSQLLERFG